jgi:protein-disulfide isomerase
VARLTSIALILAPVIASCAALDRSVDISTAPRMGPADAPIEIVVFSDFECPFCKRAAAELRRIQLRRPGRVKIFFKHFPLAMHANSVSAALAAEAARMQGRFWEMHDALFEHQGDLGPPVYPALAAEIGLDAARFAEDMASPEASARIAADQADGRKLRVDGTPFFVVNRVPFLGSYADLDARLDGMDGLK